MFLALVAGTIGTTLNWLSAKAHQERAELAERDAIVQMQLHKESARRESEARVNAEANLRALIGLHDSNFDLIHVICNQPSAIAQPRIRDGLVRHLDAEAKLLATASIHSPEKLVRLHNMLSLLYLSLDEPGKARDQGLKQVAVVERQFGADHPLLVSGLLALRNADERLGQAESAREARRRAVRILHRMMTQDDPATLDELIRLSETLREWFDEPELAVAALQHVIAVRTRIAGDKRKLAEDIHHLAWAKHRDDSHAEALILERQALTMAIERLGVGHELVQSMLRDAQQMMINADRIDSELLELVRAGLPGLSAGCLTLLGRLHMREGRYAEAETELRESLALREKANPDEWMTYVVRSLLGECLLAQRKYADAEPLLMAGYDGLRRKIASIPAETRRRRWDECLDRLIRLANETNRATEADRWRAIKRDPPG